MNTAEFCHDVWRGARKIEWWGYQMVDCVWLCLDNSIKSTRKTDRQNGHSIYCNCIASCAKTNNNNENWLHTSQNLIQFTTKTNIYSEANDILPTNGGLLYTSPGLYGNWYSSQPPSVELLPSTITSGRPPTPVILKHIQYFICRLGWIL